MTYIRSFATRSMFVHRCEGFGVRFHEKADIIAEAMYLVPSVIDTIARRRDPVHGGRGDGVCVPRHTGIQARASRKRDNERGG